MQQPQEDKDVLEEKYPDAKPAHIKTIVNQSNQTQIDFHPVIFESITPEVIRKKALQTQGAAGQSGIDAMNWKRFCAEKSNELYSCEICQEIVHILC